MAHLIRVTERCCGTCQHWSGSRELVEYGKRVKCESGNHACPWRKSGSLATARPQCMGNQYRQWVNLP